MCDSDDFGEDLCFLMLVRILEILVIWVRIFMILGKMFVVLVILARILRIWTIFIFFIFFPSVQFTLDPEAWFPGLEGCIGVVSWLGKMHKCGVLAWKDA